jgi:hypothetical protein
MKAITAVMAAAGGPRSERIAAQRISLAQRDFLFYVLRDREVFPHRTDKQFYYCPTCTSKLHECVTARVFRYIDNAMWKADIEAASVAQ